MTVEVVDPLRAADTEPGKVWASLVSKTVYPSTPLVPLVPSATFATVRVSATPAASAIFTAMVLAVIVAPVMVTTLPVRPTPVGNVAENAAPSTL